MNLHDIAKRRDAALVVQAGSVTSAHKVGEYLGVRLEPHTVARLVGLHSFQAMRANDDLGWSIKGGDATFKIEGNDAILTSSDQGGVIASGPWYIPRDDLVPKIAGEGIEVGPGLNPLVIARPGLSVRYLEDVGKDAFLARYHGRTDLDIDRIWRNYVVGDARYLDGIEDGSLDFIFSSNVFEHLMNPLGVMRNWSDRLRPGGSMIAVVPDSRYCFDLRQAPSTMAEWEREFGSAIWSADERKYEKFSIGTLGKPDGAKGLMARNYSIHCHFYTSDTFALLAQDAISRGWFGSYEIFSARNARDFGVVMTRGS